MKILLIGLFITINLTLSGKTYYVSTTGSDSNPGTIDQPFATWEKLSGVMVAGDQAFIRGGTYRSTKGSAAEVVCRWENLNGTAQDTIKIWAYPGESPVLNLDNITMTSSYCYILFMKNCNYLWVKGLRITGLKQTPNGESISGMVFTSSSHNLIENCEIDHLGMYGLNFGSGSDYNYIKNCDVHHLADPYSGYGASNGFNRTGGSTANHLYFYGCRAWLCSDDGWDLYHSDGFVTIDNCWSFWNGYLNESYARSSGDGVGFKIGAGNTDQTAVTRVVTNSLAVENMKSGFDQNTEDWEGSFASHLYNNIAYKNGHIGFIFSYSSGGDADIFRNNIAYKNSATLQYDGDAGDTHDHNSWNGGVTVTDADFKSLDVTQLARPRKADGSLPDIDFMHLAAGSDLINAGINVGMPFGGSAPDLGAFESDIVSYVPPVPVYVSSLISNSTPSVIEMTYSIALVGIVPSITAFSVQVNSVARSVNSVAVSGTKVLLTLSSPVAYGNTITVAYTKPSAYPLQTSAGGQAATLSAQIVSNGVAAPPAPAVPAYVSPAIENAAPSKIEMTYNLALANIIPAASAFSVQVNSAARTVSSVSISGTKVLLTLSSAVAYGNTVTVAYTKPSANPIQTSAGGQAASLTSQTVTNRVAAPPVVVPPPVVVTPPVVPNTAPVVVVSYITSTYSGFTGVMNASDSYDAEKDNLTFTWKVPGTISVSSTTGPVIQFLAPVVSANQTYDFTVTVSDGKTSQSKTVPVQILPYKPELDMAQVISVEASNFKSPYIPDNVLDGNKGTMWSASGNDQWIMLELKGPFNIQHIMLAFEPGQRRESYFEIYGSNDKEKWEKILSFSKSCAFSGDLQVFDIPDSKMEKGFKYIKLAGLGNSTDNWNYISSFNIFGYENKNSLDYENQIVKIYPNPARELVNIRIDEPTFFPDFIKILSLAGSILYDNVIEPGVRLLQIPVDFKEGIYVVQMGTSNITMFTQKLIVTR